MRTRLAAVAALAALVPSSPPAAASPGYVGGCVFAGAASNNPYVLGYDTYEGPLAGVVRTAGPPALLTVNCALVVNGVVQWHGQPVTGLNAAATVSVPLLRLRTGDTASVCDWVRVDDLLTGTGTDYVQCDPITRTTSQTNAAVEAVRQVCVVAGGGASCANVDLLQTRFASDAAL